MVEINNKLTLLSPAGYGNTGSSAVTNFFEEFEPVRCIGSEEFKFAHEPDGIYDLEKSFLEGHRLKPDLGIKRFLKLSFDLSTLPNYKKYFNNKFYNFAKDYINSIIQCNWDGWWHRVDETIAYSNRQKTKSRHLSEIYALYLKDNMKYDLYEPDNWHPSYQPPIPMFYSNLNTSEKQEHFLDKTKSFTDNLLQEANSKDGNYRYILLDQAIPVISFSKYLRYFSSPKVIIVDRDPRDLYAMNKSSWGCRYIPTDNVELFIKWYSETREFRKSEFHNSNNSIKNEALFIPFESLIYEYDSTTKDIMNFAGLTVNEHTNKLKCFNPELSIINTQAFTDYPELQDDIKLIERDLGEYCYPFPPKKHFRKAKSILIEDINKNFHSAKKIKYFIPALYRISKFYRNIQYLRLNKKCSGNDIIKICIKFIILPFEMSFYAIQIFTEHFLNKFQKEKNDSIK
jgi:hypothetical protein